MRVLFDTSVLVAAMVQAHARHQDARPWLERALAGDIDFLVSAHTLAELFSVLTGLPTSPRTTPGTARRLIRENVEHPASIVPLTARDYAAVLNDMGELGLSGGVVYDALIARAARKASADRLLTLNPDDFRRVWPDGTDAITGP